MSLSMDNTWALGKGRCSARPGNGAQGAAQTVVQIWEMRRRSCRRGGWEQMVFPLQGLAQVVAGLCDGELSSWLKCSMRRIFHTTCRPSNHAITSMLIKVV
jgi:hypothetical protein